ncbi:glutathione S-transferase family protein [Stappia indica]|uniref:glutathione S-transferase family protein n=1 Tax=Stappia indica TaxID=538381 RepID=UPI001CD5CB6A|nr:glutathione S-transferase family protein [Stappia indica]MCA1300466.1 glutathione S-transferase family protein [Stappia indica]
MITLYSHPMSPCAQKVRITLAEKGLSHEIRQVDLPGKENLQPWYLKLNPAGVVPTLTDGDHVIRESSLICEYLDEAYPEAGRALRSPAAHLRAEMRLWMKHVDTALHPSCGALQWPLVMRPRLLAMPEEKARALIEQVVEAPRRERQKRLYAQGLDAPDVAAAVATYRATILRMEATLAAGDWLQGDEFGLSDIVVAPYFQTLVQFCWTDLFSRDCPRVTDWLERVRARESWQQGIDAEIDGEKRTELARIGTEAWPSLTRHLAR